jgi:hypothetical protein
MFNISVTIIITCKNKYIASLLSYHNGITPSLVYHILLTTFSAPKKRVTEFLAGKSVWKESKKIAYKDTYYLSL